jgi:uncharacterized membrane protein
MASRKYRNGFIAGAVTVGGAVLGSGLLANLIGRARGGRVIRLQKSLQVGRPVEDVFNAWADLDNLQGWSSVIHSVERRGDRSHWVVDINGKQLEWDAQVEQFVPNQSIGWKSLNGPKHTGRITFSPLGDDTVLHVTMNYAPKLALLRPFVAPFSERIEGYLDQVLRDFKAALEGQAQAARYGSVRHSHEPSRATGTFGAVPDNIGESQHTSFGSSGTPLDYPLRSETE